MANLAEDIATDFPPKRVRGIGANFSMNIRALGRKIIGRLVGDDSTLGIKAGMNLTRSWLVY
ncbi:MAG: hypothetical protein DWQ04_07985 [Chloroflexi bacterium]|nr:MAG: hypothetical protein DWQ04_07985 [Chloroflexota bacterium]